MKRKRSAGGILFDILNTLLMLIILVLVPVSYTHLETLTRNDLGIADWKLLYFIPQDDLLADFGQIISSSGLLCLVCLGLSLLLIALVSASITGRLAALTGSIHRIARGDFRTRVQVSGGDEIGRIGRDFNYMAEKIDTLIHTVYEANPVSYTHLVRREIAGRICSEFRPLLEHFNCPEGAESAHVSLEFSGRVTACTLCAPQVYLC